VQGHHEHADRSCTAAAVVVTPGPIGPADVVPLSRQVAELFHAGRAVVMDLSGVGRPGLAVVDVLARARREARRLGAHLEVQGVSPELACLLEVTGLREVLLPGDLRDGQSSPR
jgi:anti-anti-sigma regulatory factor